MNDTDMSGKVCVVTGVNSGIGLETARALARMGAEVAMVCRNRARGEAARADIERKTGRAPRLFVGDLGLMADVRRLAAEITTWAPRIDVLVNNAGVLQRHRESNAEGREPTWAINHLGPFLLTDLLLDAIKAAAPSRIVTVSSGAHLGGEINFDDLEGAGGFAAWRAYGQSKLANLLFTRELARRLEGTGVTANALHPGVVATNLFMHLPLMWLVAPIIRLFLLSPKKGAQTSLYLATSRTSKGSPAGTSPAAPRRPRRRLAATGTWPPACGRSASK